MKTIDIAQLDTVTGGTLAAGKRFVTTPNNPYDVMGVNISKNGKFAYVKDLHVDRTIRLKLAPLGTIAR
jgi:hypothetical protein